MLVLVKTFTPRVTPPAISDIKSAVSAAEKLNGPLDAKLGGGGGWPPAPASGCPGAPAVAPVAGPVAAGACGPLVAETVGASWTAGGLAATGCALLAGASIVKQSKHGKLASAYRDAFTELTPAMARCSEGVI